MDVYKKFQECTRFQWDRHNIQKNWEKHKVSPTESEQVFFNKPLIIVNDIQHSQEEDRFYALGKTDQDRRLFIAFTKRKNLIRVISSRDMNKKERKIYEKG
ncbi:MAG: BrnT family toxin [Desulfobacteraceae bacterium]|nr:MAG: BrnT family toxin [Desulfobacteraceae bacterium]